MASLQGLYDIVLIVGSDGTLAADVRPLVRLNVSVILEDGNRREQGYAGGGGRGPDATHHLGRRLHRVGLLLEHGVRFADHVPQHAEQGRIPRGGQMRGMLVFGIGHVLVFGLAASLGMISGGIFVVIKGPDRGEAVRLTGEQTSLSGIYQTWEEEDGDQKDSVVGILGMRVGF